MRVHMYPARSSRENFNAKRKCLKDSSGPQREEKSLTRNFVVDKRSVASRPHPSYLVQYTLNCFFSK